MRRHLHDPTPVITMFIQWQPHVSAFSIRRQVSTTTLYENFNRHVKESGKRQKSQRRLRGDSVTINQSIRDPRDEKIAEAFFSPFIFRHSMIDVVKNPRETAGSIPVTLESNVCNLYVTVGETPVQNVSKLFPPSRPLPFSPGPRKPKQPLFSRQPERVLSTKSFSFKF